MKKKQILIPASILIILLIAGLTYNYTFNSKHRDIASEEVYINISAKKLYSDFIDNEVLATTNYLDKVIEIKGEITAIEEGEVVLNNQIQVSFNTDVKLELVNGATITIKGRCVGYDELLEMTKIDQATLIK